jgi:hypothetical protein
MSDEEILELSELTESYDTDEDKQNDEIIHVRQRNCNSRSYARLVEYRIRTRLNHISSSISRPIQRISQNLGVQYLLLLSANNE